MDVVTLSQSKHRFSHASWQQVMETPKEEEIQLLLLRESSGLPRSTHNPSSILIIEVLKPQDCRRCVWHVIWL